jgi:hypothetical protein
MTEEWIPAFAGIMAWLVLLSVFARVFWVNLLSKDAA